MPDIIITPSTGKLEFIDNSAQVTRRHAFTLDPNDGLLLDAPLSAAAVIAPLNVINVTVNNSNVNYPFVLAQSGETGAKNLLMDGTGGTYNPFTNTATIDISGNSATTTLASNSSQLNGQSDSYYTNITARLGYTPVNKAGDTVSGNLTVNGNFSVNGSFTAFSASNIYLSSSVLTVEDNILTLNAFSPYLRYAGIEMYDSGSGTLSQLLWDGDGDYFFLTGSSVNGKIITGPDGQTNLSSNYVPKATAGYKLGNSLIYDSGTNIGIGITTPVYKTEIYSGVKTSAFTGLSISNFNNYDGTANSLVKSQLRFAILENPISTYDASQRTFAILESGNEANNSSSDGFFAISTRLNGAVAEKFRITSAGNVGIGTTNPVSILDVVGLNGSFPATSNTTQSTGSLVRLRNGNSNLVLDIGGNGGNGNWLQSTNRSDLSVNYPLLLNPNGGNVGIGITNPGYKLDVGVAGSDVISVRLTPGYERVRFNTFDLLGYNDGNLWMIGNNPTNTLVLGKTWDWDNQIGIAYTPGTVGNSGGILQIGQISKNNANYTHGITRLYTNGLERITIIANGNVGIGTTIPTTPLHVVGVISGSSFSGAGTGLTGTAASLTAGTATIANGVATGAVKSGGLEENSVITSKIADGNVTNVKLASSSVTIGSSAVSLGSTLTTIAGLTSVTSTTFVGALTGNASTATNSTQLGGVAAASYVTLTGTETLTNKTITGTFTGNLTGTASTATALTSMNISQFTNNSLYQYHRTDITSLSSSATNLGQPLGTFDANNATNGPTNAWYNYLSSTHGGYLTSLIANRHRSSQWYVGYKEGPGGTPTNPTWYELLHSGNYSSFTNLTASWATNAVTALNVGNGTITIAAGTGVGVGTTNTFTTNQSGATTVTISNSGVTSNVAGSGISVSGATGAVTITNTGVTSITTNTGLSANASATGAVTITNTGVTSITTNTGLSTNASATGAVTITNTGVTSALAGTGVGVSAGTGAVTFSIGQAVGTGNTPTFAGATLNGQLNVNHSVSTAIVRLWNAGSTVWSVGVGDTSGTNFNISADFGSILINKSTGNIWISGSGINNNVLHSNSTLTAGNLSGTIPSAVLANSTVYIGTTAVALNRASANLALTGITSIDGNAATATVLQTARNIGGVSFNGSADINLPGVNTAGNQNTSGTATTATTANALNTGNSYTVNALTATSEIGTRGTNIGVNLERGDATIATLRFDADNFRIWGGGTGGIGEILRVTETGNVGIGTTVVNARVESYYSSNAITFNYLATNLNNNSPIPVYGFDVTNGSTETRSIKAGIGYERHLTNGRGTLHIYNHSTDDTASLSGNRSSAGDIKMSLDNSGNLGIGTTTPATKLDIYGPVSVRGTTVLTTNFDLNAGNAADIYGNIRVLRGASLNDGMYIGYGGAGGNLKFFSNSGTTEFMTIATTGNVGIGTTSPGRKFEISDASTQYIFRIGAGVTSANYTYDIGRSTADGLLYFYGNQTNYTGYVFSGIDGERMRITGTGNVGVGTSTPGQKLDVEGRIRTRGATGTGGFEIGAATTGTAKWRIEWDSASDSLDFNWVG